MITLSQFMEECRKLVMQGKEVYIKGHCDGTWRLVVQDKYIKFGDTNGNRT